MTISLNGNLVETFMFPGGEWQVRIDPLWVTVDTHIVAGLYNAANVMQLLLVVDAVRRINSRVNIQLTIPYFPYARQDRVCCPGEALSARVMADLINTLNCNEVVVFDPHSDVTPALLNHCRTVSMAELVVNSSLVALIKEHQLALIVPDAGAEKKVRHVAKQLFEIGVSSEVFCASKQRDARTGKILATELTGDVAGKSVLLLDDICDGGRTFIALAETLKMRGAADIYLYVTHGIFSKGLDVLRAGFKQVFCYHSWLNGDQIDPKFLTVFQNSAN